MKTRRLSQGSRALFLTSLALLQFACTKKEESGTVRIVMPATLATSSVKPSAASAAVASSTGSGDESSFNSALNPTTGAEINCFAVFIGGPDLNDSYCSVQTSTEIKSIRFGPNLGFIKAGAPIEFSVTAGQRVVYVVGLKTAEGQSSACSERYGGDNHGNLSEPFLIASQPLTVVSGTNSPVQVVAALDTSKKILDCKIAGNNTGGSSGGKPFGDKRDGGVSPTASPSTMMAGSSTLSSSTNRSGSSTLSNAKVFGASRRITNITKTGTDAGRALYVQADFNQNEFEAGDEIAWYVAAGNSGTAGVGADAPLTGACGGGFYIGKYGTSRIKSTPTFNDIVLEQQISASPLTIKNVNLSQAPSNTGAFCTIIIARISSFDSVTVPDGASLLMQAAPFDYMNGTGGLLVVRAESISIGAGGNLTLDASARGFKGGVITGGTNYQGDGVQGMGSNVIGPNYNGGAPGISGSSIGAGGGGHAGAGGNGMNSSAVAGVGGSPLNHCQGSMPCNPLLDQKTFMGGGGGFGAGTGQGGSGGGIVMLFARSITGAGSLYVNGDGASASGSGSVGSGGGAGGSASLVTKSSSVTSMFISANGGNGTQTTGGGGGGGVVNLQRCPASFSSTLNATTNGGSGGNTGGVGVLKTIDDPSICSQ